MKVYRPHFSLSTRLFAALVYVLIVTAALAIANSRIHSTAAEAAPFAPISEATDNGKPFFSLSTNRTFSTSENPRLWLDHRGLSSLDFRVYRVNDPARFFAQLSNPHQMGEDEQEQIATNLSSHPSLLERIRGVKVWAYSGIRNYFRDQLRQDTRKTFNQKFRATETAKRVPLNVADYARVPLLNPNQLVTSWREPLTTLETEYDRRLIPLGKRERGVYLVEAVGGELRAYTVVVVTDLAMVEKASPNGELLVYAVDRKNGEPQADARVEIVKARNTIASGRTNSEGMFRANILTHKDGADPLGEEVDNKSFVVLASHRDNFAISDLESFYFIESGYEAKGVQGYIYTDRPIYRPNHKVSFKGILRGFSQTQYRPIKSEMVTVTIKDTNDARVFEQKLRLSKRGTFDGEFVLPEETPLGTYGIYAETEEGGSEATFEVAEYKKPEYKVSVTTPRRFASAGTKSKFDIDARYFFGAPVAGAEVNYYVYRSHYYPYFSEDEEESDDDDDPDEYAQYNNYYSDITLEGEGKLDAAGHLSVEFDVPASNENDVWDFQYRLEAQVTDSSRRSINGSGNLIATRGSVIARATPDRYVYTKGQTAKIAISTTDYEGQPVPAQLSLKFMLRSWVKVEKKENEYDSDYQLREKELSAAEVTTDKEGHAVYNFSVSAPGSISIRTVVHENGKESISLGGFFWATGAPQEWSESSYVNESSGSIKLVPDKKSYRPGETAHVLAILPEEGANLLVTTELDSVRFAHGVSAAGKTVVLDIPIEQSYAPNVYVSVTFVKNGDMFTSRPAARGSGSRQGAEPRNHFEQGGIQAQRDCLVHDSGARCGWRAGAGCGS
jgi:uncharacterized protein YfaS (alpha-2-macroglobulin family)